MHPSHLWHLARSTTGTVSQESYVLVCVDGTSFIFVQNQTDVCQCNHKFKQVCCLLPWFRKNQDVVRKPQESSKSSPRFSKSIPSVLTTCSTYREPIQHRRKQPRVQHATLSHSTVNVAFTAPCSVCEHLSTRIVIEEW